MKDAEFIDLLNLYLDHEISAADAVRLEAEVTASPARRRVYQQYCQMQKACKLLAQDFQSETVPTDERKIISFPAARPVRHTGAYAASAFVAIAACVAVVFVSRSGGNASRGAAKQEISAASAPTQTAESSVVVAPARNDSTRTIAKTVTVPAGREEQQPKLLNALSLASNSNRLPDPLLIAADQAKQFDWMRNLQLAPVERVPIEQFRFDAHSNVQPEARAYPANRPPAQGGMEWIAIRYQK